MALPAESLQSLQQIDLLQGLRAAEQEVVAQAARRCRVEQEASFFQQGDPAVFLYVLLKGRVKLTQLTPEGQEVILRFIAPGEMFGGIAALGDASYPTTAEASKDCLALAWDGQTMTHLMERYPRIALNALKRLAARLQEVQDRYRELATERVERRVARTFLRLIRQAGVKQEGGVLIDLTLSRQDLAEMSGTTLFTVSRLLSRWEREGLIESKRKRVLVCRPHALVAIAEDLPANSPPKEPSEP